jgi:signal transduction histidine kinase
MSRVVSSAGSGHPPRSIVRRAFDGVTALGGEALRTMSATKYPRPDGRQKLGPRAARLPALPPEDGAAALVQEKVLAEIAHELGNFFHKLYYWSDYLKESPPRKSADSTAAQMLERTIKNLEDFLRVSLDYFHPTQLSFMRMSGTDVVEGLLAQVRAHLNGTPLTMGERHVARGGDVMIDPSHLSQAFEIVLRHLTKQLGSESAVRFSVEPGVRADRRGLELVFQLCEPNEASPLFRTSEAGVEWAVAQKVVALHGGELSEHAQGSGEKQLVIFLPLCP